MITSRSAIEESKNIFDVLKFANKNSFVIFDLDNTVIESIVDLGTDQWFVKMIEYADNVISDHQQAINLVLDISHAVQYHIKARAVESDVVRLIKSLQ